MLMVPSLSPSTSLCSSVFSNILPRNSLFGLNQPVTFCCLKSKHSRIHSLISATFQAIIWK